MFQITKDEYQNLILQNAISSWDGALKSLRSQFVTSKGGRRYLPYAFTEQGVAMLSSILNSERAINIEIVRTFIALRLTNKAFFGIIKNSKPSDRQL